MKKILYNSSRKHTCRTCFQCVSGEISENTTSGRDSILASSKGKQERRTTGYEIRGIQRTDTAHAQQIMDNQNEGAPI
jgi:hypothetical protein